MAINHLNDLDGKDIARSGTLVSPRRGVLNVIEGAGVTLTLADNPTTQQTDLTITATAGGSSAIVDYKDSVRLASTVNHTLSGLTAVDGFAPNVGDRVLLKNQTAPAENGIYVAASGAWTRATDFDEDSEVTSGATVRVEEGTVNGGTEWYVSTTGAIVVGTTGITWAAASGTIAGTDNSLVRIDGTTDIQGSGVILDDTGFLNWAAVEIDLRQANVQVVTTTAGALQLREPAAGALVVDADAGGLNVQAAMTLNFAGEITVAKADNAILSSIGNTYTLNAFGAAGALQLQRNSANVGNFTSAQTALRFGANNVFAASAALTSLLFGGASIIDCDAGGPTIGSGLNLDFASAIDIRHNNATNNGIASTATLLRCKAPTTFNVEVNATGQLNITDGAITALNGAHMVAASFRGTGTNSTTGLLRGANNTLLVAARNQANSADISCIATDTSDNVVIAGGGVMTVNSGNVTLAADVHLQVTNFVGADPTPVAGAWQLWADSSGVLSVNGPSALELTLSATDLDLQNNNVTTTGTLDAASIDLGGLTVLSKSGSDIIHGGISSPTGMDFRIGSGTFDWTIGSGGGSNRMSIGSSLNLFVGMEFDNTTTIPSIGVEAVADVIGKQLIVSAGGNNSATLQAGILSLRGGSNAGAGAEGLVQLEDKAGTPTVAVDADGNLGFFNTTPAAKPTVTGSRGGNAALADLLTELATLGLITDSSSA